MKVTDTISNLFVIAQQAESGKVDLENVDWLVKNVEHIALQMDMLLGLAHLSSGYSTREIEDCVIELIQTDGIVH